MAFIVEANVAIDRTLDEVSLPSSWPHRVKSSILQVVSLARLATIHTRSWAAGSLNARVRLQAKLEKARNEALLLGEEIRIKDACWALLNPHRRPYYRPTECLSILELKAARGWSAAQTARRSLAEPATIASWMKRLDEEGKSALGQTPEPVNKFPDFVRHIVRRLKTLCPTMGKKRIAQTLVRAGLHLGVTTVRRMLNEEGMPPPAASDAAEEQEKVKTYKPVLVQGFRVMPVLVQGFRVMPVLTVKGILVAGYPRSSDPSKATRPGGICGGQDTQDPAPKDWSDHVTAAVLRVISLARVALLAARGRAAQSRSAHLRLRAELAEARR